MKTLIFLLLVCASSAETLNQELRAVAGKADRVELSWRPEFNVQLAGITPLKKVFTGAEIEVLFASLTFERDLTKEDEAPLPPGTFWMGNCKCLGSHILRFISDGKLIAEVSFHHGTHLRAKALNRGRDAILAEPAQKWLQLAADWDSDLTKMEEYERKHKQPSQTPATVIKKQD